jgi:hypothetical protein
LAQHVPAIVQEHNLEKGDLYQEIFLEIGKNNIKNIIQGEETHILRILIDLMGIGCLNENEL